VDNSANLVVIGRFGRPHGIKGFVVIHSFTEPRENILEYSNWQVLLNKKWQPVKPIAFEVHSKAIIAKIDGFAQRELASQLTHAEIAVDDTQLAKLNPGEYYWHELIGMNVVNQDGTVFGKVAELIATGANDVLVVKGEKRHLIPYLPGQFIKEIDTQRQTITVDWDLDF
jgi:16S rRNA processing protein RimM